MPDQLEELKLRTFDPVLSRIVARRIIYHLGINDERQYRPLIDSLQPIVREIINPPLLQLIRSGDVDYSVDQDSCGGVNYKTEDEVTFAVRKLVELQHGIKDRRKNRTLTRLCMEIVEAVADSDTFNDKLREVRTAIEPKGWFKRKRKR